MAVWGTKKWAREQMESRDAASKRRYDAEFRRVLDKERAENRKWAQREREEARRIARRSRELDREWEDAQRTGKKLSWW